MRYNAAMSHDFAHAPATIRLGDLDVRRLGYGAMRLPGKDVWGEPSDPDHARAVLRRAIDLGINFIDTAWYYGPLSPIVSSSRRSTRIRAISSSPPSSAACA